jgi:hypothetical protein
MVGSWRPWRSTSRYHTGHFMSRGTIGCVPTRWWHGFAVDAAVPPLRGGVVWMRVGPASLVGVSPGGGSEAHRNREDPTYGASRLP